MELPSSPYKTLPIRIGNIFDGGASQSVDDFLKSKERSIKQKVSEVSNGK